MKVGLMGTGNIAPQYMKGCAMFPDNIQVVACADLDQERAATFATEYGIKPHTPNSLLASDVDIVINLTPPKNHLDTSLQVIAAGKHLYSEKPLAIELADAQKILDEGDAMGVRIGCAPDTFLGAGLQTSRQVIDSGEIGTPIAATAFLASHGPEGWHPNPFFFYQYGGGPMLDMGPYYITALVNLMGSVTAVSAMTSRSFTERTAGHEHIRGEPFVVDVSTHFAGTLRFANGALATLLVSFDIWAHHLPRIEVYGTTGSLSVPDPNTFKGRVQVWKQDAGAWSDVPLVGHSDVLRGIGVADMARSIQDKTPHRASGELALHVLEVMLAFDKASTSGEQIAIQSSVTQPAPL